MAALFVYGTLMVGQPAHELVAPWVTAATPGWLPGELYALPAGYPALVDRPTDRVHGEVLTLRDDAPWARLDAYEDHDPRDPAGSLYDRVVRPVRRSAPAPGGKESLEAWVYLMPADRADALVADGGVRIRSGRWPERNPSGGTP